MQDMNSLDSKCSLNLSVPSRSPSVEDPVTHLSGGKVIYLLRSVQQDLIQ